MRFNIGNNVETYVQNTLDNLSSKTYTRQNEEVVLQQIANLLDELQKSDNLTEEYKNELMKEVDRRVVNTR